MTIDDKARERSVSNLQRLYTVVISLAIAEGLRRLLSEFSVSGNLPDIYSTIAFISLLVTIIPFYHGANRYLDATYVTGERTAKSEALMLDFIAIFFEGIIFFILAIMIQNIKIFFSILAFLFVVDAIWVGITHLTATSKSGKAPNLIRWATMNIFAAIFIFVSIWSNLLNWEFWPTDLIQVIAVGAMSVLRTVYDYYSVWNFYYPSTNKSKYVVPAPRPAPIPVKEDDDRKL